MKFHADKQRPIDPEILALMVGRGEIKIVWQSMEAPGNGLDKGNYMNRIFECKAVKAKQQSWLLISADEISF